MTVLTGTYSFWDSFFALIYAMLFGFGVATLFPGIKDQTKRANATLFVLFNGLYGMGYVVLANLGGSPLAYNLARSATWGVAALFLFFGIHLRLRLEAMSHVYQSATETLTKEMERENDGYIARHEQHEKDMGR